MTMLAIASVLTAFAAVVVLEVFHVKQQGRWTEQSITAIKEATCHAASQQTDMIQHLTSSFVTSIREVTDRVTVLTEQLMLGRPQTDSPPPSAPEPMPRPGTETPPSFEPDWNSLPPEAINAWRDEEQTSPM